jgi:hypothetical protein
MMKVIKKGREICPVPNSYSGRAREEDFLTVIPDELPPDFP